jgi:hypothetical protein
MNGILGLLHTIGYVLTIGAAIWAIVVLMRSAERPSAGRMSLLVRIEDTGIGLLWFSGLIMVWSVFGGPQNLPAVFWIKIVSALVVTASVVLFDRAVNQVKLGQADRGRMLRLNWIATGFVILTALLQGAVFYSSPQLGSQ